MFLSVFLRVQYSREWVITLCSNPKITRLAQLQSGPHYTALQNRGRNTRPIKTKRESGDVRKDNFWMAGVHLTRLWGECPGGTAEQSACHILSCPGTKKCQFEPITLYGFFVLSVFPFCYWVLSTIQQKCHWLMLISWCIQILSQKHNSHIHTHCAYTFPFNPWPLVWSRLGLCQRSLFT